MFFLFYGCLFVFLCFMAVFVFLYFSGCFCVFVIYGYCHWYSGFPPGPCIHRSLSAGFPPGPCIHRSLSALVGYTAVAGCVVSARAPALWWWWWCGCNSLPAKGALGCCIALRVLDQTFQEGSRPQAVYNNLYFQWLGNKQRTLVLVQLL